MRFGISASRGVEPAIDGCRVSDSSRLSRCASIWDVCAPRLTFKGNAPSDYTSNAGTQPPFGGVWGFFSWAPAADDWIPRSAIEHGPNLLHWVRGFAERFEDGE